MECNIETLLSINHALHAKMNCSEAETYAVNKDSWNVAKMLCFWEHCLDVSIGSIKSYLFTEGPWLMVDTSSFRVAT
jgi:hypothetical protein